MEPIYSGSVLIDAVRAGKKYALETGKIALLYHTGASQIAHVVPVDDWKSDMGRVCAVFSQSQTTTFNEMLTWKPHLTDKLDLVELPPIVTEMKSSDVAQTTKVTSLVALKTGSTATTPEKTTTTAGSKTVAKVFTPAPPRIARPAALLGQAKEFAWQHQLFDMVAAE